MPGLARPRVDIAAVATMRFANSARQPFRCRGNKDEMHVVWHQTISKAAHTIGAATLGQQIAVERIVTMLNKDQLPSVSALRDMMR